MKKITVAIKTALVAGAALTASTATASDKELLETLLQNGVLNKAQFEKLSKQAEEKAAATEKSTVSPEMAKALDWASRIKISGDMRARYENVDVESKIKKNRQRVRARIGIDAKINDEVDAGVRLVTAGGRTSTNQSLGLSSGDLLEDNSVLQGGTDGFKGKLAFIDRAFIKWRPNFAKGSTLTVGKFKQPWYRVSNNVWDSDVNPEGVALDYTRKFGAAKVSANGGYYILSDNFDDGHTSSEDMNMYHAGLSGEMRFNDSVKASLGGNTYLYNHNSPRGINRLAGDRVNGTGTGKGIPTDDVDFKVYEVASKVDIDTGYVPVKVYGNYVINASNNVDGSEDTAWLIGFGTKWNKFKFSYDYRDTQRDAVPDTFNDSDFNRGATGARGHTVKLAYKISKNFSFGGAYMAAEDYTSDPGDTINVDTFQLDLKAKF